MASLREIRKRITSVRSTQKITRAMKMIAAARLKKIQQQTLKSRSYAEHLKGMVLSVAERSGESYHPLMEPRKDGKNVDWIVVTSDRGLCGSLNENLMRRLMSSLEEYEGNGKEYCCAKVLGRKGEQFLKRHGKSFKNSLMGWAEHLSVEMAEGLAREFTERFLNGETDQVVCVYNRFKSAGSQEVVFETILPLSIVVNGPVYTVDYIYEPSREAFLDKLVHEVLVSSFYQILCESLASELAARLMAMDQATRNADEMIKILTGRYNRARQASITRELIDIVTGVEAMK